MTSKTKKAGLFVEDKTPPLDGRWSPPRRACHACGAELLTPEHAEAFSEKNRKPSRKTVTLRANHVYDLSQHRISGVPDWVTSASDFWCASRKFSPWMVTLHGTFVDRDGTGHAANTRICDTKMSVFVRRCQSCGASDPLEMGNYLTELGAERIPPPHDFVAEMRAELERIAEIARERHDERMRASAIRRILRSFSNVLRNFRL